MLCSSVMINQKYNSLDSTSHLSLKMLNDQSHTQDLQWIYILLNIYILFFQQFLLVSDVLWIFHLFFSLLLYFTFSYYFVFLPFHCSNILPKIWDICFTFTVLLLMCLNVHQKTNLISYAHHKWLHSTCVHISWGN